MTDLGGGELDRERQTLEAVANFDKLRNVLLAPGISGIDGSGAIYEELYCGNLEPFVMRERRCWIGNCEWRYRDRMLPFDAQQTATSGDDLQLRSIGKAVG